MNILILHQAVGASAQADEQDVLDQVGAVREALEAAGHTVGICPVTLDLAASKNRILQEHPDRVFNLVESLDGADRLIATVPALLEILQIAYTGNPADTLTATTHKLTAKRLLRQAGLPTPDWIEIGDGSAPQDADSGPHDWILKSAWDHASAGMTDRSLLRGVARADAARRLDALAAEQSSAWFAERYIEGREFNLALYEQADGTPEILPPAEIRFVDYPPGKPRIVDYAAKWEPDSFAYTHTPRTFDLAPSDRALADRLRELGRACWKAFDLRGYARVDFRVDAAGQPWILEINANPCLAPDAGFAAALHRAGIPFADCIGAIVAAAGRARHVRATEGANAATAAGHGESPKPDAQAVNLELGKAGEALVKPPVCASGGNKPPFSFRETVVPADGPRVRGLAAATGYFNDDEVKVAEELVVERLRIGEASGYFFVFAEDAAGTLAGYACFGPIACTVSSYDLYWIAVSPAFQNHGLGRELSHRAEAAIRARGGTRLYAETSNRPQYASTRAFYERTGFELASLLDDFYAPGDGRATYLKVL